MPGFLKGNLRRVVSAGLFLKYLAHINKQTIGALAAEAIVDADIGFRDGVKLYAQARSKSWLNALQPGARRCRKRLAI